VHARNGTRTPDRAIGREHRGELLEYNGESGHAILETSAAREHATA
jgi:hypothetical protein